MTNALITVMESPALPMAFDVTEPAAIALIAQGWTPPEQAADD